MLTQLAKLHPAIVHFPIATSILAVLTLALYLAFKRDELKWMWALLAVVAALAAIPAVATGIIAATGKGFITQGVFPSAEHPRIRLHETLALIGTALSLVLAYLAYSNFKSNHLQTIPVGMVAIALAGVWGFSGHLGGENFWRDGLFTAFEKSGMQITAMKAASAMPPEDESAFAPLGLGADYLTYEKMNTKPWPSDDHGGRLVNTHVNSIGAEAYKTKQPLPVGSVVVKESFEVDDKGKMTGAAGPVFVMVKKEKGYAPENGDWYYAIHWANVPESFSADIGKQVYWRGKSPKVGYCYTCHNDYQKWDFLGGVPKPVRVHAGSY
jgi:uncharacterized membrane protein